MRFNEIKYFYPEKPVLILIETDAFEQMSNDPDYVAEPKRKKLIPHFTEVKEAAIKAGALGVGISGSGPSIMHPPMQPIYPLGRPGRPSAISFDPL